MQVAVKAGDRDRQQAAQHPERIASPFTRDEGVPHLDCLAKNAVAFFGILRCILSVAFSARSRASSLIDAGGAEPVGQCLARHVQLPRGLSRPN